MLSVSCLSESTKYAFSGDVREFAHSNGLIVKIPITLAAQAKENGFLIEPADNLNIRLRNSLKIEIEKRGDDKLLTLANLRQKTIANRTINYQIERNDGGSGGDEYHFTAWEKVDNDLVVYEQTEQSEYGEPDFANCWQIIAHTWLDK